MNNSNVASLRRTACTAILLWDPFLPKLLSLKLISMSPQKFYTPSLFSLKITLLLICCCFISFAGFSQVPEVEPNNTFESADNISAGTVKTATVNNSTDPLDYFTSQLSTDGTMKIYVQATNTAGSNGYLYLYGYDVRKGNGQVLAKYISNTSNVPPGTTIYDTIVIHGRTADAFYFRFEAPGAFTYSFKYEVVNISENDIEPNNDFEHSLAISRLAEKKGHIGYIKSGGADGDDFYKTALPIDGTFKIFVKGTNQSGANGYMYLYGYDGRKGNGQVLAKYISNTSNVPYRETIYDTIILNGRAADSFYFRIQSAGAFDYSISYDLVDSTLNDAEPNNTFDEPVTINPLQELKGHIGYVKNGGPDADDFYKTTLPVDGTLKIYVKGTNQSGGSGYMYMYGYDARKGSGQVLAHYIANSSNIAGGATITDTIILHGRAADVFYFRLQSAGAFSYTLSYAVVDAGENDIEPNNTFKDPTAISQLEEKKGHIGYVKNGAGDADDIYKTVLPIDGTLKIYIQGTNKSGGNGYMYMYGYDRRKGGGQIFATYISGNSNIGNDSTIYDTITIYGILADTFYFRIQSAGAFTYKLSYNTQPNSQLDDEPNNTFDEGVPVRQGITKNGQVGYQLGGVRDNFDYYKTLLPADGSMKIYVQGTNNSGGSGYLYLYGFDKRKGNGQVLAKYIANTSNVPVGTTIYDTIFLYGRASDSFYFRFESAGAFSYNFSYDIIDTSENDVEPNNTFEDAITINRLERKKGHIGYVKSGSGDADDFYKAVLPEDGTLKIYVKGTNNSGASGYMYLFGYDGRKVNGQVVAKYISNNSNIPPGISITDTIILYGRASDTVYYRIQSAGAFSYSVEYDLTDITENDVEPNNTFEQSITINAREVKKGHIGYVKNGAGDGDDFYKTILPGDGSLKIYIQGTNRSGGNSYMFMYGYDGRKGSGQVLSKYIANSSNIQHDSTIYDSITLYGRAADTFYFRIQAPGAFSYSFNYDIADTTINDAEPNNNFDQTLAIDAEEVRKGHIGYVKNGGADADDFYKTVLPTDGTLKIYVQGTNNSGSNGYMFIYGYDTRKGSGQVLAKYVANSSNIVSDSTIYDTISISCRAADTFYFRIQSAGAFNYQLSYKMDNVSANDLETNNTFETAKSLVINTPTKGHIGYESNGGRDNDDFYKAPLPGNGTIRIIVEATNTSGGGGYLYLYGYDNRKNSGQVLAKYVTNSSNIPAGTTIRDTIDLNCYYNDTLFTRWTSSGCFSYTFHVEFVDKKPKAAFDYTRVGDLFSFSINSASNAENFMWDLGNSTTTTNHEPPLTTYVPGFYEAKLIASNTSSGCNFTDTATKSFTIKGIERYTPAAGGQGLVDFAIYGGGLTNSSVFKLTKGGSVLTSTDIQVSPNGNIYISKMDLHSAAPGVYDVDIITPDSSYHYANGFTLESGRKDKLRVEIIGRNSVRNNADYLYTVRVHNDGNTNTGLSEVYLLTSEWFAVRNLDSIIFPVQVDDVNPDTLSDVMHVTASMGFPVDGQLRGYFMNDIPPGGFKDVRFIINILPHSTVGQILAWAKGPYSGSPYFDWVEGCWKSRIRRAFTYGNIALNKIPVVDCGWNVIKTLAIPLTASYTGISSGWDVAAFFGSVAKTGFGMIKHCAGEATAATGVGAAAAPAVEIAADLTDIPFDTYDIIQMEQYAAENCPDQKDKDKKTPDARNSLDPNEKTGPTGYGANHYISASKKLMDYGVFFENKATATAPAQTVIIVDTLDMNVFNLHTFKIGTFGLGTKTYGASIESKEFVTDVNINDDIAVRANMKLDTLTGILKATFKTIDRHTGDITDDPLAGFLPPNINAPEGDGFFTYSIELKDGLPGGTQIKNKATIIFDNNDAIVTNEWSNTIDNDNPSSTIQSITKVGDSVALIIPNGSDISSGVEMYQLYVSIDGAPYVNTATLTDSVKVSGREGKTYNFYVLAVDSVGNIESKNPVSEGSITFGALPVTMLPLSATKDGLTNRLHWTTLSEQKNKGFVVERSDNGRSFSPIGFVASKAQSGFSNTSINYEFTDLSEPQKAYYRLKQTDHDNRTTFSNVVQINRNKLLNVSVFPNPAYSEIFITGDVPFSSVQLTDMSGKTIRVFSPSGTNRYDISGIQNGVYILQVSGSNAREQVKIVIQSH